MNDNFFANKLLIIVCLIIVVINAVGTIYGMRIDHDYRETKTLVLEEKTRLEEYKIQQKAVDEYGNNIANVITKLKVLKGSLNVLIIKSFFGLVSTLALLPFEMLRKNLFKNITSGWRFETIMILLTLCIMVGNIVTSVQQISDYIDLYNEAKPLLDINVEEIIDSFYGQDAIKGFKQLPYNES